LLKQVDQHSHVKRPYAYEPESIHKALVQLQSECGLSSTKWNSTHVVRGEKADREGLKRYKKLVDISEAARGFEAKILEALKEEVQSSVAED
jgi:hypothetical protein